MRLLETGIFLSWLFLLVANGYSQINREEYIESSSPTVDGGLVVSRSDTSGMRVVAVSKSSTANSGANSVLEKNVGPRNSVFRQTTSATARTSAPENVVRYPYPANQSIPQNSANNLRLAQVFSRNQSSAAGFILPPVRASATCTNCQVPYQTPTLGFNSNAQRVARPQLSNQGNCCSPAISSPVTALQVPALQAPVLQIQPPVANQPPSLAPNTIPQNQLANPAAFSTFPNNSVNQIGQNPNRWWSPFVTGSGVYQPVIRIANLRPGTYLGQGIIGQPTAYVDGQPIRNLLRYISP